MNLIIIIALSSIIFKNAKSQLAQPEIFAVKSREKRNPPDIV